MQQKLSYRLTFSSGENLASGKKINCGKQGKDQQLFNSKREMLKNHEAWFNTVNIYVKNIFGKKGK